MKELPKSIPRNKGDCIPNINIVYHNAIINQMARNYQNIKHKIIEMAYASFEVFLSALDCVLSQVVL